MKLCLKILAIAITAASTYSIIGCSAPPSFSYSNVSIALTAGCTDCPGGITFNPAYPIPSTEGGGASSTIPTGSVLTAVTGGTGEEGGVITFTAAVTNAPQTNMTWTIYPQPNLGGIDTLPTGTALPITESVSSVGLIQAASGNTAYYSTPSGFPIYGGAALEQANAMGIPQGDILLVASVPDNPNVPSQVATNNQLIQLYGQNAASFGPPATYLTPSTPTTPAGITTPAVTVARGTSFQFYGGTVGASPCSAATACGTNPLYTTDNSSVWAVGTSGTSTATGVVGGNSTLGTITQTGLYTAPANIPNPLPVVLVWSHVVTSKFSFANVGVN